LDGRQHHSPLFFGGLLKNITTMCLRNWLDIFPGIRWSTHSSDGI
jgi:hypothetical protein